MPENIVRDFGNMRGGLQNAPVPDCRADFLNVNHPSEETLNQTFIPLVFTNATTLRRTR